MGEIWNDGQQADTREGHYYVTASDAGRVWRMAGPFVNNHAAALAAVRAVSQAAMDQDGRACFVAWGTCRFGADVTQPGPLNHAAGLEVRA